ncbi:hypothetical protein Y032_0037g3388 [Ancylostoma ceylanicum]|uniref:Uncharacterized protein n=1 Tax=Ancylostoma ceylanicum TaxID=53326 RepID=A0A016UL12_9BILA|nr:hypothetical protein Y032_0037g3388 [Ancylostoma ceylanicum]
MVVIFVLSALENPRRYALVRLRAKMGKIGKIDKSISSTKMVVVFMFSLLINPNRHVFASLWSKVAKNQ